MAKSYKRISATVKSIEILEYLANQKGPVSCAQVAAAMNLAYDTVMCHLATLTDLQCVIETGEHYELGFKMSLLWARYRARLKSKANALNDELKQTEV